MGTGRLGQRSLFFITITSQFLLREPAGWARVQAILEPAPGCGARDGFPCINLYIFEENNYVLLDVVTFWRTAREELAGPGPARIDL